jgi:hypothetical protein
MSKLPVITDANELAPGWYCIGFEGESGEIDWVGAPIYHYIGDDQWEDDDGSDVESFFDPLLQLRVATDAADAYLRQ